MLPWRTQMTKQALVLVALLAVLLALAPGAQPVLAQSGNSWTVYYYNNTSWSGSPVYTTYSNFISYNWGTDTPPAPGMPAQNWTAQFVTNSFFYAGIYNFQITADDEFLLYVDGVQQASTIGAGAPGKTVTVDIPLNQGNHAVQIQYRQYTGQAYIYVNWTYAKGGGGQPAPPPPPAPPAPPSGNQLFPPPSTGPMTQFGDYTSCAQQQIHQKNCFQSNGAWNAPNMGSIATEPQILRWMNCTSDQVQSIQLYTNQPAESAKCSKTEAGYFPN